MSAASLSDEELASLEAQTLAATELTTDVMRSPRDRLAPMTPRAREGVAKQLREARQLVGRNVAAITERLPRLRSALQQRQG